jgi:hypothetical protein
MSLNCRYIANVTFFTETCFIFITKIQEKIKITLFKKKILIIKNESSYFHFSLYLYSSTTSSLSIIGKFFLIHRLIEHFICKYESKLHLRMMRLINR